MDQVDTRRYWDKSKGGNDSSQDNLGAISWTNTVQGLRRVKHVALRYHYVRSIVEEKIVRVL